MRKLPLLLCLIPSMAFADAEADKGLLVSWLQDKLSGAGRQVRIEGFQGALSSRASLTEMTIADDQGVWLTLKDVTLDWNRAAILSGRVEVQSLTAAEIDLSRLPKTEAAPTPEAGSFSLPELPVAVAIQNLQAPLIHLGPDVLGQDVVASLSAELGLEGGAGSAKIDLQRKDATGAVQLTASYANGQDLALDLQASEGAGGIAATRLGVPGAPATGLKIKGSGPLSDFTAQVDLSTDGVTRLGGLVTLKAGAFSAVLAGDPTPVFLPAYAEFFGPAVSLQVKGSSSAAGLVLDQLSVQTAALALEGQARITDGQPSSLALTGRLGLTDGSPVLLPLTTPVSVVRGDLSLFHDETEGPGWTLSAALDGLTTDALRADHVELTATGESSASGMATGQAGFSATGLKASDPALAQALGSSVTGSARFQQDAAGFALQDLTLTAPGMELSTLGRFDLTTGFSGRLSAKIDNLNRFSLYREGLAGAAAVEVTGSAHPLTGAFDLAGSVTGQDLALGQAEADGLLRGASTLAFSAKRDTQGLELRSLDVKAPGVEANLSGRMSSLDTRLAGRVTLPDLALTGPGRKGQLSGDVTLEAGKLAATIEGQGLGLGQPEADRLLAGASRITVAARLADGAVTLQSFDLTTDQLTAKASGPIEALQVTARLANLGLFVPEFPGPLTLSGTAGWKEGGTVDLDVKGPGQIAARVAGRIGETTALTARGTAAAALANPFLRPRSVAGGLRFDLALNALALSGLSGSVTLTGGRFADPSLPFGLTGMQGDARISGGRVSLNGSAQVSTGGGATVAGTVGLSAPYTADLAIRLAAVTLRDPQLYETSVSGDLSFTGPALGGARVSGALALGRTELRIPSSMPASATLAGLRHRGDSAAVKATRARATAGEDAGRGGGGPAYPLDIRISAPNQVFLRGRGLDAELGGALTLGGTSADIQPQGGFTLLRGRMDILGRRLTLSEATLDLQGALVPIVHVVASVETDEITATVTVDGPATAPEVSFTSSPALPQEEVLAQLLFGRGLETISAFQAAQLAGAVATLAGRGGDGILGQIRAKTGLDNLDLQTDGTGGGSLTAGKYLSEKLYSEVTVDSEGKSEISLNIDVARHITLKAQVDSEGASGAGIFLKKDY